MYLQRSSWQTDRHQFDRHPCALWPARCSRVREQLTLWSCRVTSRRLVECRRSRSAGKRAKEGVPLGSSLFERSQPCVTADRSAYNHRHKRRPFISRLLLYRRLASCRRQLPLMCARRLQAPSSCRLEQPTIALRGRMRIAMVLSGRISELLKLRQLARGSHAMTTSRRCEFGSVR